jgi:hypothetical protein
MRGIVAFLVVLLVVGCLALFGCGGGGSPTQPANPIYIAGDGVLPSPSGGAENPDGSYRWALHFTATQNGLVDVEMDGAAFSYFTVSDPFVAVFKGTFAAATNPPASALVGENDGPGGSAEFDFGESKGQAYTVYFTVNDGSADTGTFGYVVQELTSSASAVQRAPGSSSAPFGPESKLSK